MANIQQFANNASSILAGSSYLDSNPSSENAIPANLTVPFQLYIASNTGSLFPSQGLLTDGNFFIVTLENISTREFEIFKVTAVDGDKFTISGRAQEGTTQKSFPIGSKVELRWTRDSIERVRQYARDLINGYTFNQNTTSSSWAIQHNLNKFPEVQIWVLVGGNYVIADADIKYVDANNVLITFSEAVAGKALLR